MTLNDVIALILRFSPNVIALLSNNVTMDEYKNKNIVSQFQSSTFGQPTLQCGLSVIAELLVCFDVDYKVLMVTECNKDWTQTMNIGSTTCTLSLPGTYKFNISACCTFAQQTE